MNSALFKDVSELLPHTGEIILISGVDSWNDTSTTTFVNQDGSSVFANDNGDVSSWVGIEYMAQTISIFAGIKAKTLGKDIRIGFLLGTRKYTAHTEIFKKDTRLSVYVERVFYEEDSVAVFACSIYGDEKLLAEADVKAIQPKDPIAVLEGGV